MSGKDIVIIGCGAGGGTSAQFARKTDRKANIKIFEKGLYPQFSKCGLPYVISGKIPEFEDLIEFSTEWFKKANIDLQVGTTVLDIDSNNKILKIRKNNMSFEKEYTSLVIATGADPYIPPIKNIQNKGALIDGVYVFRTIEDGEKIKSQIKKDKKVVIVGAGLIGLELADNLLSKEMDITVVEALGGILSNTLDEDMTKSVYDEITNDIKILINHIVVETVSENGRIKYIKIKNRINNEIKKLSADILIIAVGTKPVIDIAKKAGCRIGETGHIFVNERSETSVDDIYSVGDCTEYVDMITQKKIPVGLGSIVVRQGIAAGINAAGGSFSIPRGILQTRTTNIFGVEIAAVGPTAICLNEFSFVSGKYTGDSRPEYFPDGKPITIKVLANSENGRIIGAQAFGDKAAQRINTFACAILAGMDIETFRKLETAYAPPVAPILDAETLVCDIVSMKLSRRKN